MTQATIKTTNVFHKAFKSDARITCLQGGTRSSKTYSLCQLFIVKALNETGKVFTICRKTLPALKGTAYRDVLELLKQLDLYSEEYHNKSELSYTLNGNLLEFISVDQPQKIRGRKRDYLWLNEANEFTYEDYQQLILRTTDKIYLDYNPSDPYSWIYEKVITRDDCTFIKSTYKANPFLDKDTIAEIDIEIAACEQAIIDAYVVRDVDDLKKRIQELSKKRKEIEHKDESKQYVVVADEYQLPFSETGFRSNIFDKKETEKVTKENLKQWIIDEAYLQLGLKPGENPWEEAGVNPVTFIKEVKFNKKKDDI